MLVNFQFLLFSIQMIGALFLTFLSCSAGDDDENTIDWSEFDPYTDTKYNFTPFLNRNLCADSKTGCTKELHDFILKTTDNGTAETIRASCEQDPVLKVTVCWLRQKFSKNLVKKRTKYELQFWYDVTMKKSRAGFAFP
uniref:Uncharacterized protein n=1 Tax=Cacopsylla melanoneura TaxID=428564 RepID=A0A8D8XWW8_9HEMI